MKLGRKVKKALQVLSDHCRKQGNSHLPYGYFQNKDNGDVTLVLPAVIADDAVIADIEKVLNEAARNVLHRMQQ